MVSDSNNQDYGYDCVYPISRRGRKAHKSNSPSSPSNHLTARSAILAPRSDLLNPQLQNITPSVPVNESLSQVSTVRTEFQSHDVLSQGSGDNVRFLNGSVGRESISSTSVAMSSAPVPPLEESNEIIRESTKGGIADARPDTEDINLPPHAVRNHRLFQLTK